MRERDERLIQRLQGLRGLGKLIGVSLRFRDAIAVVPAAARSDAAVLIAGETGTGKELVARAIHYLGPRAPAPFVAVNCGALTDTLLEDELFGHEPGAFTDARQRRIGLVARAHGGTLFLDEVDALSPRAQVTLLRVLQDRQYRPLGSSDERRADVRFLAATNTELLDLVEGGRFRADLYYRICVFRITLPPLRERADDVPALAGHFLRLHAPAGRETLALSPAAQTALHAMRWPGNVRELENVMLRAAQVAEGPVVEPADLGLPAPPAPDAAPDPPTGPGAYKTLKRRSIESFEHGYLVRLLRTAEGNVTRAARLAGKDRRDLGRLIKKHRLDPRSFAPARV